MRSGVRSMEIWKDVKGYEKFYEVSNYGRVRSKERTVNNKVFKPRYISGGDNGKGYKKMILNDGVKKERVYIHRIVAEAFIPNPLNKPYINHIDNNPNNNCASNLEWCTPKENMMWMHIQGRAIRTKEWLDNLYESQKKTYKKVIATNIETGEEITFDALNFVRDMGFQPSCVCNCCKGKRKQHKGYSWKYEVTHG